MRDQPGATRTVGRLTWSSGDITEDRDEVVRECPVALVYNGVSHVVMMVTPVDLEDFALGFSLSEGILGGPEQLLDLDICEHHRGLELQMRITAQAFAALKQRRRNLVGRTGCGLCGAESLDQAIPEPAQVAPGGHYTHAAIQRALSGLRSAQHLQPVTGSVHAAAFADTSGQLLLLREDVGRHNALDKVLGALVRDGHSRAGLALVTSRASYEMVAKTASAGIPLLAAMSAPTSLAIDQAERSGITLLGYVGEGRQVVYTHRGRIAGK